MSDKKKLSILEKEQLLLEKIEKAKQALARLQHKKKSEIGALACKHGLDDYPIERLDQAFAELAQVLQQENNQQQAQQVQTPAKQGTAGLAEPETEMA